MQLTWKDLRNMWYKGWDQNRRTEVLARIAKAQRRLQFKDEPAREKPKSAGERYAEVMWQ